MGESYVDEVQRLVERLASRIHRSVAIDDPDGNLIAVSRHYGDADDYRIRLILSRRASPEYRDYFRSFTATVGANPVAVPAREDLSLRPRICFPIRKNATAFAFLWVIDTGPLLENVVLSYCERLADLLYERRASDRELSGNEIDRRLSALLAGNDTTAAEMAAEPGWPDGSKDRYLIAAAHLPQRTELHSDARQVLQDLPRLALDLGLDLACLTTVESCVVGAYATSSVDLPDETVHESRLVDEANRLLTRRAADFRFGLSLPCGILEVRQRFAQAAVTSFICTHLYRNSGMLPWRQIGNLATFLASGRPIGGTAGLGTLEAMLRNSADFTFETLAALLHHQKGDSAAEALQIHRTTLHYRLQQIERRTGLDLQDSADRFLATCLWLQVALAASGLDKLLVAIAAPARSEQRLADASS